MYISVLLANLSDNYHGLSEGMYEGFGSDYVFPELPENIPSSAANYFNDYQPKFDTEDFYIPRPPVICKPMPGILR